MTQPSSEALAFTEKELETAGAAQELLDAPTIGGGVPGLGVVVGESKKSNKPSEPPGIF